MSEFMTTIGEVAEVFDGPHATPKKTEQGPYFLSISSLENGALDLSKSAHLSEKDFIKWTKRVTPTAGDVLFSYETRLGDAALMPPNVKACLGRRMGLLRPNTEKVIPEYLLYAYLSPAFQEIIKARTIHGATVNRIALKELPGFPIRIPPKDEQEQVVNMLSSIDSKLELNRQINQTLEQIAQAIFKSWFVDFEPVKAKIEAKKEWEARRPTAMDGGSDENAGAIFVERAAMRSISGKTDEELDQLSPEQRQQLTTTAALFPDELEDSELGEIPKGWAISEISDIAVVVDCLHAKKPEIVEENTGNIFLQLKNISDDGLLLLNEIFYISDGDYKKWISRIEAKEGDCVITNVGRVGAVAQIPRSVKAALGRNMTAIRCREDSYYPSFMITLLTSSYLKREIELRTDVGTILNALNVKNIPKLRFVTPGSTLLEVFERGVHPLQRKREMNIEENRTLGLTRDSLLPKLLSGEIAVEEDNKIREIA